MEGGFFERLRVRRYLRVVYRVSIAVPRQRHLLVVLPARAAAETERVVPGPVELAEHGFRHRRRDIAAGARAEQREHVVVPRILDIAVGEDIVQVSAQRGAIGDGQRADAELRLGVGARLALVLIAAAEFDERKAEFDRERCLPAVVDDLVVEVREAEPGCRGTGLDPGLQHVAGPRIGFRLGVDRHLVRNVGRGGGSRVEPRQFGQFRHPVEPVAGDHVLRFAADAMRAAELLDHQFALFELQPVFAVAEAVRPFAVLIEEVPDPGLVVRVAQHQRHARDFVIVREAQPRIGDAGDVHRAGRFALGVGALFRRLEVVAGALGVAPVRIVGIFAVNTELEPVSDIDIRPDAAFDVDVRTAVVREDGDVPVQGGRKGAVDLLGVGHGCVVPAFSAQFVEQLLHVDVGAVSIDLGLDDAGQLAGAVVRAPSIASAAVVGQDLVPRGEVQAGADFEAEGEV